MYSPKYTITNKILKNIGSIEAAKEVVENAPLIPYFDKKFKTDALVRTVHHGTHIEGNDLTLTQTKKVLEGQDVLGKERDIQEVINYRRVVHLLDELAAKRGGYDLEMLTDIHKETVNKIVSVEKLGLRKTQVVIKEQGTGKVVFEPPPAVEVEDKVRDFLSWLNSPEIKEAHPILVAGIAHYVLVSIHPFVEGNGRTVRAFAVLVLMREGYDIKRFFALEEHFDADLEGYYGAFAKIDNQGGEIDERDLTSWLEYFTEVVAIELEKVKEKVRRLSIDSRIKLRVGEQIALSDRQMKLIEYFSEYGVAGMNELKKVMAMVSEDTILRDLKKLIKKGIVEKKGSTKASVYSLKTGKAK